MDDRQKDEFIEAVLKNEEIMLDIYKKHRRWSKVKELFLLPSWVCLSNSIIHEHRSMRDSILFLTDSLSKFEVAIDEVLLNYNRKPISWNTIQSKFVCTSDWRQTHWGNSIFSAGELYKIILSIKFFLEDVSPHIPETIDLGRLKKRDLELIKKAIQFYKARAEQHEDTIKWGIQFESIMQKAKE